jgi:hypothetical protein
LAIALASGTNLNAGFRGALLLALVWLARHGWRLLGAHTRQPRRVSWGGDGRWQLQDATLGLRYVQLRRRPQQFGPLIWLPLGDGSRDFPVLIDGRYAEPVALCALQAALTLHRPS